jgi:hypothetical protein
MTTTHTKKSLVEEHLSSDQLGEYNYILQDITHAQEQIEKFQGFLSKALEQKERFEELAQVLWSIESHNNQEYTSEED